MKSIFIFFKDFFSNLADFFQWSYLTISPSTNIKYFWVYISIFVALIIAGLILNIYLSRTRKPRFKKRFLYYLDNFLIYIPLAFILQLVIRKAGIEPFNTRLTAVILGAIWLIWFGFLLYYLLVIMPKFSRLYVEEKRREKYFKDGSKRKA